MPVIRDPATGLDCTETPFRPSKVVSRDDIAKCNSCTLVFSAPNAGPKTLSIGPKNGIEIDESPLTQIIYNSQTFSLFKTFLWPHGLHRDFKTSTNYDMEMNLYFRDIFKPDNIIGVVIPITISDALGKPYFTELNGQKPTNTLESIINTDGPVLMYKGMDLRGRDSYNMNTMPQCKSVNSSMTWFIISTTYITSGLSEKLRDYFSSNNYAKPKDKKTPAENTPPLTDKELTLERVRQMCMIIPTINTKTNIDRSAAANKVSNGIVLTRALQCQRIDPSTDIKGDAVYLNGPSQGSLQEELDKATDLEKPLEDGGKSSIRAKTIERVLGIVLGVILGLLIFGVIGYYCLKFVYKDYDGKIVSQEGRIHNAMVGISKGVAGFNPFAQTCPSGNKV
jgi:hypothetical protein